MNYYTTIRVKLTAKDRGEALEQAADLTEDVKQLGYAENPYLCYITEQDGLQVTELLNNVD